MDGDIVGPLLFKDDRERNVTVNGERYANIIKWDFSPFLLPNSVWTQVEYVNKKCT